MKTRDLYRLAQTLDSEQITMCYSGYISQKVLVGLAASLRSQIAADDGRLKRVTSVFVEQVQNIMKHSAVGLNNRTSETGRFGMVTFGLADGRFFIIAGNEMLSADAHKLRTTLEEIGSLNRQQLLARYRERMNFLSNDETDIGALDSAGLGLLEIARHVSQPVEFDLIDLDNDRAYFIMKAYI
jgi:ABC-type transporter Mla MlaB component